MSACLCCWLVGGCEFAKFFETTPQDLIVDGLYKALALALYPGPFWPVSVVLVAHLSTLKPIPKYAPNTSHSFSPIPNPSPSFNLALSFPTPNQVAKALGAQDVARLYCGRTQGTFVPSALIRRSIAVRESGAKHHCSTDETCRGSTAASSLGKCEEGTLTDALATGARTVEASARAAQRTAIQKDLREHMQAGRRPSVLEATDQHELHQPDAFYDGSVPLMEQAHHELGRSNRAERQEQTEWDA